MDYWPDVHHPVGYHPTTTCTAQETRIRGFNSWMSRSVDGTPLVDPMRVRNVSYASQVFGAAHLVCDAYAYSAPGHKLNPFYMQSKWKPESTADPAIPLPAPSVTLEEMQFLGTPSREDTDTTYPTQFHPSDSIIQHTVGGLLQAEAARAAGQRAHHQDQDDRDGVCVGPAAVSDQLPYLRDVRTSMATRSTTRSRRHSQSAASSTDSPPASSSAGSGRACSCTGSRSSRKARAGGVWARSRPSRTAPRRPPPGRWTGLRWRSSSRSRRPLSGRSSASKKARLSRNTRWHVYQPVVPG